MIDNFVSGLSIYLQESILLAYVAVYLAGVLISFTPCIYPVLPITVAFIGARGAGSRTRSFLLSIVYVFGMALTYTALGAAAALSGRLFGHFQASFWIYFIVANVCVVMGLSMLDVFVLAVRTPAFITRVQPREKTRGIAGSFAVGALSGLVVGPCTAPVFAVLLGYVASRQNVVLGMSLLFVFAFGLGTLLVIAGTSAGLLAGMPRSGPWMARIKHLFGWVLLGAGEYFLIKAGTLLL
ncbi:MAG: sulfite exporter TauE/SafE family protein [Deltaproteobacteria bacterium]|nr:sulfite exporter TauE/SafE family protein [Deltaproteobacteria bacterium]